MGGTRRRVALGQWVWAASVLPGLVAIVEFLFEIRRIRSDVGQAWSRDWDFNQIYAMAYARLYFGSAFAVLFLLGVAAVRGMKRFRYASPVA